MTAVAKVQNPYPNGVSRSRGLSLVELLVALGLSASLTLGIVTVYANSSRTVRLSDSLARIQEAGRIATNIMAHDIRMVGYQGCADPGSVSMTIIAEDPPTGNFFDSTLRGWEVTSAKTWAGGTEFDGMAIETDAVAGSDVISIQRGDTVPIEVSGNMSSTNANIQVAGNLGLFAQDDIVLISDCEHADLFRISSNSDGTWAHAKGVNTDNRLSQAYNTSATIMRFSSNTYYVADTGRDDGRGEPIYALYRLVNNMKHNASSFTVEELVEGVESMQILYGERVGINNIRYVEAGTTDLDMTKVVAIKIGLLISHAEAVQDAQDQLTYRLPGQDIAPEGTTGAVVTHPKDNRIRRIFQTTISLRNRI